MDYEGPANGTGIPGPPPVQPKPRPPPRPPSLAGTAPISGQGMHTPPAVSPVKGQRGQRPDMIPLPRVPVHG